MHGVTYFHDAGYCWCLARFIVGSARSVSSDVDSRASGRVASVTWSWRDGTFIGIGTFKGRGRSELRCVCIKPWTSPWQMNHLSAKQ